MKDVFLVYDRCCFYEIVILCYFLHNLSARGFKRPLHAGR